jgi:hypothetical protein
MKLAQTNYDNTETGCCARLNRDAWEGRELRWERRPFVKDHMVSFLHIPLNFGSVIAREQRAVESAAAYPEEPFWLVDEVSPWGADVLLAVDRDVPGARMETLSGTFMTKVFEGPYRDIGKWMQEMEAHVAASGRAIEKTYFFYATCPKCAKHFGKNEVVLFAQVAPPEGKDA